MNLLELVTGNRSYRRFDQNHIVDTEFLRSFVNLARLSASGRNQQILRYLLVNTPENCERVFECLAWAGYLPDWEGPQKGEQPSAYIILLRDKRQDGNLLCDEGLAIQNILLGAVEKGLGGCIIRAIDKPQLRKNLTIGERYDILYVLAIGKPIEQVCIEPMENDNVKYWRDAEKIHHVPKRNLDDLIVKEI